MINSLIREVRNSSMASASFEAYIAMATMCEMPRCTASGSCSLSQYGKNSVPLSNINVSERTLIGASCVSIN